MDSFIFHNPAKVYFGANQIQNISQAIPKNKKVLLVYGKGSIKQNGVYDEVTKSLANHKFAEFAGIEPNPKYETLMQAVEKAKQEDCNYILAVGGGSVIDGAKFIAAAFYFKSENAWDICHKRAEVTKALPIGCVLTLPATSSETNTTSVVSKDESKLAFSSPFVQPEFAILDPSISFSLPKRQIANGVVDAYIHVMEQYCTYNVNAKVQDRYSEGLLLTLLEEGPKAMLDSKNIDVNANIMWAASQALNGMLRLGVPQDWTSHRIGHELTALYGIDHARTLSIILPAVLKVCSKDKQEKLLQYGERVFGITKGTIEEKVAKAISKTEEFFEKMDVPTRLSQVNLNEKDINKILENMIKHGKTALGENKNIDIETSKKILLKAL